MSAVNPATVLRNSPDGRITIGNFPRMTVNYCPISKRERDQWPLGAFVLDYTHVAQTAGDDAGCAPWGHRTWNPIALLRKNKRRKPNENKAALLKQQETRYFSEVKKLSTEFSIIQRPWKNPQVYADFPPRKSNGNDKGSICRNFFKLFFWKLTKGSSNFYGMKKKMKTPVRVSKKYLIWHMTKNIITWKISK